MQNGTATRSCDDVPRHDTPLEGADDTTPGGATPTDASPPLDGMKFPWSPPSSSVSPPPTSNRAQGHRRTLSGSILSRFSFLRANGDDGARAERPPSREKEARGTARLAEEESISTREDSAMASALKQNKAARKRKGSLRKTALLGGRRFASEGRERRGSLLQRSPQKQTAHASALQLLPSASSATAVSTVIDFTPLPPTPAIIKRQFSYETPPASRSTNDILSEPAAVTAARLSLVTGPDLSHSNQPTPTNASGATLSSPLDLKSPASQASTTSNTTSDEEPLTFERPTLPLAPPPNPVPSSSSYYHPAPLQPRPPTHSSSRSRSHRPSPLSHTPHYPPPSTPDPSSTTSTSTYGYILLATTWIIFTIGMGSCLEVWSWAWDVGETPYAPPELEDDATLPIVGYYPALIVLTAGVVSWVWVAVAWVGMKYFRHAKIEV